MNAKSDKNARVEIPESLRRQMRSFELALYESETALAAALILAAMFLAFLLLFGSDRLWDTTPFVRTLILTAGVLSALTSAFLWLKSWIFKRRNNRELAREIQRNHSEFGDRLLSSVELADGAHADESVSEELMRAAIAKTAEKAEGLNFAKDVDRRKPSYASLAALLLIGTAVFAWQQCPEACLNAYQRLFNPFAEIPRYTFTVLKPLPEKIVVPKNEPFELRCGIDPIKSRSHPSRLEFSIENVCSDSVPVPNGKDALLRISGVENPVTLEITAGDASASVAVIPKPRPALKTLHAEIAYPKYTGLGRRSEKLCGSTLEVPIGAEFALRGEVVRRIVSAELTHSDGTTTDISVDGVKFATLEIRANAPGRISINWKDTFGMTPATPCSIEIRCVADREPFVKCPGLAPFSAILAGEVLKVTIDAEDDYGIRSVDAEYELDSVNGAKPAESGKTRVLLVAGDPKVRKLAGRFPFSPKLMGIKEKTLVTLWGTAGDFKPGRKPSRSAPHKIYVLSREQHAKIVSDRLKRIMADMEDMARREEESLAANKKISKLSGEKIKTAEAAEKVRAQAEKEVREKRWLDKLTAKTAKLLKEALRNKKFPNEALKKWSEFLEKMRSMSKTDMPKMVGHLNKSAEKSAKRADELAKAMKAQTAMLKKLREMLNEMDDSLNSLELATFVNRLKKQAKTQKNISSTLKRLLPQIIGLKVASLPLGKVRREYETLLSAHKSSKDESREIRGDLSAFFSRTRLQKYKKVV
ncbi:MAG: hypothetical protein KAG97_07865, partial [Victivallales bacterium]|nr:hypothetical protein [Victivallales bacterium]